MVRIVPSPDMAHWAHAQPHLFLSEEVTRELGNEGGKGEDQSQGGHLFLLAYFILVVAIPICILPKFYCL